MNGILNVLKPPGMTSFDVVAYLRGVLKLKKIGHTGTLDPGAAGVLPVCLGRATKAIEFLTEKDKFYRAEMVLGISTDTQDSSGSTMQVRDVTVNRREIIDAVEAFRGVYLQTPPMYSAIKLNGKKLYELARDGISVERQPREVVIYQTRVINIAGHRVIFDVACSKGTYIRTLCADIGERLGCGGHMSFLLRTKAGVFDIASALTLEDISALQGKGMLKERFISVDEALDGFKPLTVAGPNVKKLLNGVPVVLEDAEIVSGEKLRIYSVEGTFIGIGEAQGKLEKLFIKMKKVFWQGEHYESNL